MTCHDGLGRLRKLIGGERDDDFDAARTRLSTASHERRWRRCVGPDVRRRRPGRRRVCRLGRGRALSGGLRWCGAFGPLSVCVGSGSTEPADADDRLATKAPAWASPVLPYALPQASSRQERPSRRRAGLHSTRLSTTGRSARPRLERRGPVGAASQIRTSSVRLRIPASLPVGAVISRVSYPSSPAELPTRRMSAIAHSNTLGCPQANRISARCRGLN
jgi:hypothetical protein